MMTIFLKYDRVHVIKSALKQTDNKRCTMKQSVVQDHLYYGHIIIIYFVHLVLVTCKPSINYSNSNCNSEEEKIKLCGNVISWCIKKKLIVQNHCSLMTRHSDNQSIPSLH